MAIMKGDPKDPNAWWAVKLTLAPWMMEDIRNIPKRVYWLAPLVAALALGIVGLGLYKIGFF